MGETNLTKCFVCGKDLRKYDALRGIVDWHPEGFCLKCLIKWNPEEKQRSISKLCEGGEPVPFFMIPDVLTPDPIENDDKNLAPFQKGNIFRGHLVFTNKGIYFVQLYEFRKNALPPDEEVAILGALFGGFLGRYIGQRIDAKIQKTSEKHEKDIATSWARFEEEAQASKDLMALLQKGHAVLSYRKDSIVSISYNSKKGFEIKATGKSPKQVFFMVNEEAYKQIEPMIKEYMMRQ
jgi:hypothetical protein